MKQKFSTGRRKFLATAGAGGTAAAAVALTGRNPDPAQPVETSEREGKGYRLTEHIKKYYETTKV